VTSDAIRTGLAPLVARLLIVAEFAVAVNGKISGWDGQAAYMTSHGMHFVTPLLAAALAIELVGSLCLVSGFGARPAAAVMFVYLGIVTVRLHNFWAMTGNAASGNQTQFFKNLGIMGGLLMIASYGPGAWALGRARMTKRQVVAASFVLLSVLAVPARAQGSADSAAIRATAMDYIEGWYAGDATRMERALHPELAKRVVTTDPRMGHSQLESIGAMTLVLRTRAGGGKHTPPERQQKDFSILDIFNNAAVAKVVASDWVDYLQLAKWNGRWVIVNVLWEYKSKAP
jgi:uncharacterized membrane protein YphA (DoxX/SURF4 family)